MYRKLAKNVIDTIKFEGRYRIFRELIRPVGAFPYVKYVDTNRAEKNCIAWCSNDYLNMSHNKEVVEAAKNTLLEVGVGAGGTRNIAGSTDYIKKLENRVAKFHNKESGLLFSGGYLANFSSLSVLGSKFPNCVIFSDADNHASMIEGIRRSGAKKEIFKHNNVNDLQEKIKKYPKEQPKIVAFESVYSMDGSISPISNICDVAKEHNALTYIDEIHAVALYGKHGAGITERDNVADRVDIIMGGLGKGFGTLGGYITGDQYVVDLVRSNGSGFIFTTALPPPIVSAAEASIDYVSTNPQGRNNMWKRSQSLKNKLISRDFPVMNTTQSHIIPLLIGDSDKCNQASEKLLFEFGHYIQPINYPTVPIGTERLRITPSAEHTEEMIDKLVDDLESTFKSLNIDKKSDYIIQNY